MLSKIKAACKMLKGVIDVRTVKEKKMDITETASYKEAMEDVKAGRIHRYESVEDFIREMEAVWRNIYSIIFRNRNPFRFILTSNSQLSFINYHLI